MMNSSCRAAIYTALTGLLTAGAITAGMTAASANTAGFCSASSTSTVKATCTVTHTISSPASVAVGITMESGSAQQNATTAWTATCTLGSDTEKTTGGSLAITPVTDVITLPFSNPDTCTVTATGTLSTNSGKMLVALTYTPATSASPTPTPSLTPAATVRLYKGFGGKCLDDAGNSSANLAKVIIWTCNSHDRAQGWTYSGGQLIHNGKCLNDQAWGGNGSKVILWTCNRALNELWTHLTNGEFVLNAKGYRLCLDDPASSTRNGTQLIVWTCKNSTNQHWVASLG
jgi:ricin-type beta-trefoil lectin protein